ncbi:MAG: response regulator [Synechococcales bacterium]|nr:response regulator [Synechococcales bacterium]
MNMQYQHRIALVEENKTTRLLLKDFLELSGYQVFCLPTDWLASSVWPKLAAIAPDLIVLDLQHPSMAGLLWLRRLRLSPWHHLPVIATSVALSRQTQTLLHTQNVHCYLVKPFCLESLKQSIDGQLTARAYSVCQPTR